jgi:hypothetical protein
MKRVVISGSAKRQPELRRWKHWWREAGFEVIYCPELIDTTRGFLVAYQATYKDIYKNLLRADILFVMNEDKKDVTGYIGAQTFAEASYVVANNLVTDHKRVQVIVLKMPSETVPCYEEVATWIELCWAVLLDDWKKQSRLKF